MRGEERVVEGWRQGAKRRGAENAYGRIDCGDTAIGGVGLWQAAGCAADSASEGAGCATNHAEEVAARGDAGVRTTLARGMVIFKTAD